MDKSGAFQRIFEPGRIGKLDLKNRIVMAPMGTRLEKDHIPTPELFDHYSYLAAGGAALVTVESTFFFPLKGRMGFFDNSLIPRFAGISKAIHASGAKASLQINPSRGAIDKANPLAPSDIVTRVGVNARAVTIDEIRFFIEGYGKLAWRAKEAGFDTVCMHGANGYLISEFLSPFFNKRTDEYGGTVENRARFAVELVKSVRANVGPDFPVIFRFSASENFAEGLQIEEGIVIARMLEEAGVDAIDVVSGIHQYAEEYVCAPSSLPYGYNIPLAGAVKKAVSIPVVVTGSMDPYLAEDALREGKTDFIGVGRGILADPELPIKWQQGRLEDVRPCIRCLHCMERIQSYQTLNCAVNPAIGNEKERVVGKTGKKRRVAVIGGGPAGMEAAITAAERGHEVTLFEKRQLGGALIEASTPEFKADIRKLVKYLDTQVRKAGVTVVSAEATAKAIKDGKFDVAIVATGSKPWLPDIPGLNKPHVIEALDAFRNAAIGKSVVVIGGGLIGRDAALHLAQQGKKVTITTRAESLIRGADAGRPFQELGAILNMLSEYNVEIRPGLKLEEVTDNGAVMRDKEGNRYEIKADNVVIAAGLVPDKELGEEIRKIPDIEVNSIGDCVEPRMIHNAIHEGYFASCKL